MEKVLQTRIKKIIKNELNQLNINLHLPKYILFIFNSKNSDNL